MAEAKPVPALAVEAHTAKPGTGYPEPFFSRMGDGDWRRLGDAFGLTQFGVNLENVLRQARSRRCGTGTRSPTSSSTCWKASSCCAPTRAKRR